MNPLALLLLLAFPAAPAPQDPPPPAPEPSPEAVRAAVEGLERAFSEGQPGERLRAIEAAAGLAAPEVAAAIGRGLRDAEAEVRAAAVDALRYMPHPAALDELHALLRKDRELRKRDKELAQVYLAIGQHASPGSLALLADGPLDSIHEHSTRARILAMGRVRDPQAVAELVSLMNKAGRGRRGPDFRNDFRLALWALTGSDEGTTYEAWQRWWNDNKRDLTLPEGVAETPRELAARWRMTWRSPGERGEGPAGGRGQGRRRGGGGD